MRYTPLRLRPCYQSYLWGGSRLKREFGKTDAPPVTAESWELACHPDGMSLVDGGPYAGMSLAQLGELDRRGFWGSACTGERFPLLVKLIDAREDLSIQVHPSEENARPGERGKAELWYIVDCEPRASLYLGFSRRLGREEFLRRAEDGTICRVLNRVPVSRGDVFYVRPGTIHAIGRGILAAEIQQNANTTFRVYDYRRRDAAGRTRELHLERAAETVSYAPVVPEECRANSAVHFPGFTVAEMFSGPFFRAYRVDVRGAVELRCDGRSFQHLLCVEGEGRLLAEDDARPLRAGDSWFLPAAMGPYSVEGRCRMLLSRI